MKINFAGPARTIALVVTPNTKVEDVKSGLEESEGLPVDQQRIVFEGTPLQGSKTLGSYGVQAGGDGAAHGEVWRGMTIGWDDE